MMCGRYLEVYKCLPVFYYNDLSKQKVCLHQNPKNFERRAKNDKKAKGVFFNPFMLFLLVHFASGKCTSNDTY